MKYAFIKMVNPVNGSSVYIEPCNYERYKHIPIFIHNAQSLVVFDNVYIGAFNLLETDDSLRQYNSSMRCVDVIPINDVAFIRNTPCEIGKLLGADNC